ncbi:MAG: hypothetical protein KC609_19930 [Myxococcales bacterium]|nr:hypothetical protein [Myxococcales bacterium]
MSTERSESICPFCRAEFLPQEATVSCRRCGTVQHRECWEHADERCSVFGCGGTEARSRAMERPSTRGATARSQEIPSPPRPFAPLSERTRDVGLLLIAAIPLMSLAIAAVASDSETYQLIGIVLFALCALLGVRVLTRRVDPPVTPGWRRPADLLLSDYAPADEPDDADTDDHQERGAAGGSVPALARLAVGRERALEYELSPQQRRGVDDERATLDFVNEGTGHELREAILEHLPMATQQAVIRMVLQILNRRNALENGRFTTLDELRQIPGVPRVAIEGLRRAALRRLSLIA